MRFFAAALMIVVLLAALRGARAQETTVSASAQEVKQLEDRVDTFFEDYTDAATGPESALRDLLATSPFKDRAEARDKLIEQVKKLESLYGKATEHEVIVRRSLGRDLVVFRCLLKAERFPIVWHFYYYRPPAANAMAIVNREWTLIEIRFDTNLDGLDR